MGISWVKERNGHYTCDGGWSVTFERDPQGTINQEPYVIRYRDKEQGRSHTLRQALTKAGLMFGNAKEARLAATGPFLTRQQVEALAPIAEANAAARIAALS